MTDECAIGIINWWECDEGNIKFIHFKLMQKFVNHIFSYFLYNINLYSNHCLLNKKHCPVLLISKKKKSMHVRESKTNTDIFHILPVFDCLLCSFQNLIISFVSLYDELID